MQDKNQEVITEVFNPIAARDRVYEIDETLKALHKERNQLIEKLGMEGFKLIEKQQKNPEPNEWRSGDIVTCVKGCSFFNVGDEYMVDADGTTRDRKVIIRDRFGAPVHRDPAHFRWVRRPAK